MSKRLATAATVLLEGLASLAPDAAPHAGPLPSWNDGATKRAITAFIARTTADGSRDLVPPADRVAVFDDELRTASAPIGAPYATIPASRSAR